MKKLNSGYTSEVDIVDEKTWYQILHKFDDANIYQTWAYDAIRYGRKNISHMVLKRNNSIVAAAQIRIMNIPILNIGFAYVRWGPLWRLHDAQEDVEVFRQAIRALRNEYACKRGLVLRLRPLLFDDYSKVFLSFLKEECYTFLDKAERNRTLLIDLSHQLEDLRKGLKQKWRNCLNRSEKNDLDIVEGKEGVLFQIFIDIYREMLDRKRFVESSDINKFRLIQEHLPDEFKMHIMICRSHDNPCAGAIFSAIGDTGVYLFGATSDIGMKSKGSYLLQWKMIEWLKNRSFSWYNLHGINPETNPGTYRFKTGLGGKNSKDVYLIGQFDTCENLLSLITFKIVYFMRESYRNLSLKLT